MAGLTFSVFPGPLDLTMTTLLTFEVFRGTGTEQEGDRLRREIETELVKRNWKGEEVHTTFTKEWASVDDVKVKTEFAAVVVAARKAASVGLQTSKVKYVVLCGLRSAVASSF